MSTITIEVTSSADTTATGTLRSAINQFNSTYNPSNTYTIQITSEAGAITLTSVLPTILYPVRISGVQGTIFCNGNQCFNFDYSTVGNATINGIFFNGSNGANSWGTIKCNNVNLNVTVTRFTGCGGVVSMAGIDPCGVIFDMTNGSLTYTASFVENSGFINCGIFLNYSADISLIYCRNCPIVFTSLSARINFSACNITKPTAASAMNIPGFICNTDSEASWTNVSVINTNGNSQSGALISAGYFYNRSTANVDMTTRFKNFITNRLCYLSSTNVRLNRGVVYNVLSDTKHTYIITDSTHGDSLYTIFFCIYGILRFIGNHTFTNNISSTSIISYGTTTTPGLFYNFGQAIISGMSSNMPSAVLPFIPKYYGTGVNVYNCSTVTASNYRFNDSTTDVTTVENSSHGIVVVNDIDGVITIGSTNCTNLISNGPSILIDSTNNTGTSSNVNIINMVINNTNSIGNDSLKEAYGNGGAFYFKNVNSLTCLDISITDSYCLNNGGAMYIDRTVFGTQNITINSTKAGANGGAIYYAGNNSNTIIDNISITSCMAGVNKEGNKVRNANGGGIYVNASEPLPIIFTNNYLTNCTAYGTGGSLYIQGVNSETDKTSMDIDNTSNISDGVAIQGAQIYTNNVKLNINYTEINGGNIIPDDSGTIAPNGQLLYIDTGSEILINNCSIVSSQINFNNSSTFFNIGTLNIYNTTIVSDNSTTIQQRVFSNSILNISDTSITSDINVGIGNGVVIDGGSANINRCSIDSKNIGVSISQLVSSDTGNNIIISNSTVSKCNTNIINLSTLESSLSRLINCTIYESTNFGIRGQQSNSDNFQIGNTIINNFDGIAQSLGYNLVEDNSGISIFNLPTDINNTDPLLGPYQNNGGNLNTYATLNYSPCLNKGDNSLAIGLYDNRGEGFNRIVDDVIDIGSFENQDPVVCMVGMTKVLVGDNKYVCANELCSGDNILVNVGKVDNNDCFEYDEQKIVKTIVSTAKKWLVKISKGSISNDNDIFIPNEDVYVTTGHVIVVDKNVLTNKNIPYRIYDDNKILIKARDLVLINDKCIKVRIEEYNNAFGIDIREKVDVFSFVLEESNNIIILNGMETITFGKNEWDRFATKGIQYRTK